MRQELRKITIEEAKKYSHMFGNELLQACPKCEFYLVIEQRMGKPEHIVSMVFECEHMREDRERRRRAREQGEHVLTYSCECINEECCYLLKEITKSSENLLT